MRVTADIQGFAAGVALGNQAFAARVATGYQGFAVRVAMGNRAFCEGYHRQPRLGLLQPNTPSLFGEIHL